MRLIESYLSEVGRYLPADQCDDILSELRSSLEEQVLDVAGGSTPNLDDEKKVINSFGHPLQVASGFQGQRHLVGPELFPSFVLTLKTVLILVALIQVGLMLTAFVTSGWTTSTINLIRGIVETLFWTAAIIVAIFAVLEYSGEQLNWYKDWTADSLSLSCGVTTKHGDLINNLIFEGVFLLWWNDVLVLQNWIPGAREVFTVTLGEAWSPLFWPLNILFGVWLILHAVVLIRGLWKPAALYAEIALGAIGIAIAAWLLTHSPLVNISGNVGEDSSVIASRVVVTVIIGVIAITLWDTFLAVRRLRQTGAQ
jgi:hypothetical protein